MEGLEVHLIAQPSCVTRHVAVKPRAVMSTSEKKPWLAMSTNEETRITRAVQAASSSIDSEDALNRAATPDGESVHRDRPHTGARSTSRHPHTHTQTHPHLHRLPAAAAAGAAVAAAAAAATHYVHKSKTHEKTGTAPVRGTGRPSHQGKFEYVRH
jgi:hypothetical protein